MNLRAGFKLGEWTVLPLESRLFTEETESRVQPKSMDVLLCLAEAGGEVVERDELLGRVWGGRAVSDEPLTRCIGDLRRALGDSSSDPRFILTIPKRGYRLVQPAAPLVGEDSRPTDSTGAAGRGGLLQTVRKPVLAMGVLLFAVPLAIGVVKILDRPMIDDGNDPASAQMADKSIVVLPFVDMSAEGDQEYMGDGIAEELLNLLAKIRQLRVISRSSSFSLKGGPIDVRQVSRQFGVGYVLEGSVRTFGDRIRVTAQLVDGRTDTHIWSETYERSLDDVFAIQDEIASAVARKLQVTLLGDAPKSRATYPEAYAQFLRGRYLHEQPAGDSMQRAFDFYEAALEIDPEYVPAWVWLAALYDDTVNSSGLPRDEVGRRALDAIARALEIDPDDPLALGMSAVLAMAWQDDLAGAALDMQRAVDLDPANPILLRWAAIILTGLGRHDEAVRLNEYLFARDPIGNITRTNLAATYLNAGRFVDAIRICEIEVAVSSSASPCGSQLILAYLYGGDAESALAHLERVRPSRAYTRLAPMVYHALGRQSDYERAFAALRQAYEAGDPGLAYWIAHTHLFIGNEDAMFNWLQRSAAEGVLTMPAGTAYYAAYDDDPRWQRLMASLGRSRPDLDAIRFVAPGLN